MSNLIFPSVLVHCFVHCFHDKRFRSGTKDCSPYRTSLHTEPWVPNRPPRLPWPERPIAERQPLVRFWQWTGPWQRYNVKQSTKSSSWMNTSPWWYNHSNHHHHQQQHAHPPHDPKFHSLATVDPHSRSWPLKASWPPPWPRKQQQAMCWEIITLREVDLCNQTQGPRPFTEVFLQNHTDIGAGDALS